METCRACTFWGVGYEDCPKYFDDEVIRAEECLNFTRRSKLDNGEISCWYDELLTVLESTKEDPQDLITTLTDEELHEQFPAGFGGTYGRPFTAWGKKYVYFPVVYDGSEWVGYAPRNPCCEKTKHQGGS